MKALVLASAIASFTFTAAAHAQDSVLSKSCDEAAASPLDENRPSNVPGVAPDKIDPKVAIPACEAAAKEAPDDPRIAFQLGRAYFAAKVYESARTQYEKATKARYGLAANNLASIYLEGLGVPTDIRLGISLLESAADNGAVTSMMNLGDIYFNGDSGVAKDYTEARRWYEKAAAAGDASAAIEVGWLHLKGYGVPKDQGEARRCWRKAADLGSAAAMAALGATYENGLGGPKSYSEARRWYEKAAAGGNEFGMANLGNLYKVGRGVPVNFVKAREWYEKAAAAGNSQATYNLGILYYNGEGVQRSHAEARRLFEKAASLGYHNADKLLTEMENSPARARTHRVRDGGYYSDGESEAPRLGLSNRGAPCFMPSEQAIGGCQ
jgi:uncharacterized protein